MGQRLVVRIVKDSKVQAAVQYTWDGRTLSAFMDACDIIKALDGSDDLIWQLYNFVLSTTGAVYDKTVHGGVMKTDRDEFMRRYTGKVADADDLTGDGSCGLLAFSDQTICKMEQDAVMNVTLNLNTRCADMSDTFTCISSSEYLRIFKRDPKELPAFPFETMNIPFSELRTVLSTLSKDGGTDYYVPKNECYLYVA